MRLRLPHAPYVANKVAIDLSKSAIVRLSEGVERVSSVAQGLIEENLRTEKALEERAKEIIEENEADIEFNRADSKQLFWMIKNKLSKDFDLPMNFEERFNALSHKILDALYEDDLIIYDVSENRVRNIIFNSINDYLRIYEDIEESVHDKIENYKREVIVGSEDYEIIFKKLYEEELVKRGMC